jgi:hypothetical protein
MSQHVEQGDTLDQGDHAAERTPPCGFSTSHRTKNEFGQRGMRDMSEIGKTHIVIMWTVGPDDVAEVIVSSRLTPSG